MTIPDFVEERGIREILHFTTDKGLVGTLAKQMLLSREQLPDDQLLKYIFTANCDTRKDPKWINYVSMSITRVNPRFFDYSVRVHKNERLWWCVLSFDPEILSHNDVVFASTNNIYTGVRHGTGLAGLAALFAPRVVQYVRRQWGREYPSVVTRSANHPPNFTTCDQAEVLYPIGVSTEYLRVIYVPNFDLRARALSLAKVLNRQVNVVVRPEMFANPAASGY